MRCCTLKHFFVIDALFFARKMPSSHIRSGMLGHTNFKFQMKNEKFGLIQWCLSDPFLVCKSEFWFLKLPKKLNHDCFFKLNEFLDDIFRWPSAAAFHYLSNCKTVLLHFFAGAGGGASNGASNGAEVVVNATKKTEDTSLTTTQIDQREPPPLVAKNVLHQTSLSTTTPLGMVTSNKFSCD